MYANYNLSSVKTLNIRASKYCHIKAPTIKYVLE